MNEEHEVYEIVDRITKNRINEAIYATAAQAFHVIDNSTLHRPSLYDPMVQAVRFYPADAG